MLRKKIANADEEIADLELRLKNAEKKGDADTAIWANARIMTERRKIADAEKALLTHPNVLARNNAPVTAKISPTRKPKSLHILRITEIQVIGNQRVLAILPKTF